LQDLVFKAVGVGSVGTYCFIGLFESGDAEPLFLQVKEARRSVLEAVTAVPYTGHQGRRVVEGQRIMQAATDIFLGWTEDPESGREFHIRRLKSRHLRSFSDLAESQALEDYGRLCGRTLARAHARSGDPGIIAGYMGKSDVFDDAIASFAMLYTDRTITDHAEFVQSLPVITKEIQSWPRLFEQFPARDKWTPPGLWGSPMHGRDVGRT
jgi:uncharacterized protein (DUF2252 family)